MNKGFVAVLLSVIFAVVIIVIVLMVSKRRVATRVAPAAGGQANVWSFLGSLTGAAGNVFSSWKTGSGTAPVGGKQVVTNTGDTYFGMRPDTRQGLNPAATTWGVGGGGSWISGGAGSVGGMGSTWNQPGAIGGVESMPYSDPFISSGGTPGVDLDAVAAQALRESGG